MFSLLSQMSRKKFVIRELPPNLKKIRDRNFVPVWSEIECVRIPDELSTMTLPEIQLLLYQVIPKLVTGNKNLIVVLFLILDMLPVSQLMKVWEEWKNYSEPMVRKVLLKRIQAIMSRIELEDKITLSSKC